MFTLILLFTFFNAPLSAWCDVIFCKQSKTNQFKEVEEELAQQQQQRWHEEEDKENEIPEMDDEENEQLQSEEPEIVDIYEDSSRHMQFLVEKSRNETQAAESKQFLATESQDTEEYCEVKKDEVVRSDIYNYNVSEPPLLYPLPPINIDVVESTDEDYQKVSVKELISNFENVQQKVHVKSYEGIVKESSTESELSEGKQTFPGCFLYQKTKKKSSCSLSKQRLHMLHSRFVVFITIEQSGWCCLQLIYQPWMSWLGWQICSCANPILCFFFCVFLHGEKKFP